MTDEKHDYKHCDNCGQGVSGTVATSAADSTIRYCNYCGKRLAMERCANKQCPYNGRKPPSS